MADESVPTVLQIFSETWSDLEIGLLSPLYSPAHCPSFPYLFPSILSSVFPSNHPTISRPIIIMGSLSCLIYLFSFILILIFPTPPWATILMCLMCICFCSCKLGAADLHICIFLNKKILIFLDEHIVKLTFLVYIFV